MTVDEAKKIVREKYFDNFNFAAMCGSVIGLFIGIVIVLIAMFY